MTAPRLTTQTSYTTFSGLASSLSVLEGFAGTAHLFGEIVGDPEVTLLDLQLDPNSREGAFIGGADGRPVSVAEPTTLTLMSLGRGPRLHAPQALLVSPDRNTRGSSRLKKTPLAGVFTFLDPPNTPTARSRRPRGSIDCRLRAGISSTLDTLESLDLSGVESRPTPLMRLISSFNTSNAYEFVFGAPVKISGFNFLRNAQKLGYPFVESIRSVLPLVDEFVVALGPSDDDTEKMLREIGDPKIRIIPTRWNEGVVPQKRVKGYVYGQQKSIALFNCTGDWAFYLEGDEVLHESELPKIRDAMKKHLDDPGVEALAFDYLHFYGNANTVAWSPAWYRSEVRIIRNTIPVWGPEGLFFVVQDTYKKGRYPRAVHSGATIYHYGWVRSEAQMCAKIAAVLPYWRDRSSTAVVYAN